MTPDYTLSEEGNVWVATHVSSGVASQGSDPTEAIERAEEAAQLASQEHQPGGEEFQVKMLRECGISPEEITEEIETPDEMP